MKNYLFGFIGTGNMGGALAKAVAKSTNDILLANKEEATGITLAKKLNCDFKSNEEVAQSCKYIFLGVKPQIMAEMLEGIKDILKSRKDNFVLISMAAGLSIDTINQMTDGNYKVIRIMPNTPVEVGLGEILYCANSLVTDEELGTFFTHMQGAGMLTPIDESLMNAGCSVSGCGPAFVYMFIKGMAQGGIDCGIDPQTAISLAAQTVLGSAKLLLESGIDPDILKQNVCSPGGSTIEGVKSLEKDQLEFIIKDAVKASYKRNVELGKKD